MQSKNVGTNTAFNSLCFFTGGCRSGNLSVVGSVVKRHPVKSTLELSKPRAILKMKI